ncbi:MAG: YdcF family protein [Dorea sp.]|jgi:uncharacterized SAM-binding protein YcdF (DUF218 family)|nr:YdcF family protein [Dorea sp.]MCI9616317.1 YdcF family protein [Dorea sp.]
MKRSVERLSFLTAGFLTANILFFSVMFRRPKVRWEQDQYDCAIVCGCRVLEDGTPSDTLKKRVEKAVELWKDRKVQYLIMSGAAVCNDQVEAEAMKRYAVKLGVPAEYILKEKQAVSTYHNLKYSSEIMKNCNFRDCVVVTSGWHLRKADHYARQNVEHYVMAASGRPDKEKVRKSIWLHVRTNLHMYLNMWRGYY